MQTEEQLKEIVRKKYSEIALQDKETNMSSCCGAGGCSRDFESGACSRLHDWWFNSYYRK